MNGNSHLYGKSNQNHAAEESGSSFQYIRHFLFVECNDVTTRSSRSFDKFIFQT